MGNYLLQITHYPYFTEGGKNKEATFAGGLLLSFVIEKNIFFILKNDNRQKVDIRCDC